MVLFLQTGVAHQRFLHGGRQPLILERKPIIWKDFYQKLHENIKNLTDSLARAPRAPPPDPPTPPIN